MEIRYSIEDMHAGQGVQHTHGLGRGLLGGGGAVAPLRLFLGGNLQGGVGNWVPKRHQRYEKTKANNFDAPSKFFRRDASFSIVKHLQKNKTIEFLVSMRYRCDFATPSICCVSPKD